MTKMPYVVALITGCTLCCAVSGQVTAPDRPFPVVPSKVLPEATTRPKSDITGISLDKGSLLRGTETLAPTTATEEALHYGNFVGDTMVNLGGANPAYKTKLSFRGRFFSVFIKPDKTLHLDNWGLPPGTDNKRADAAFHLNKFLNLIDTPAHAIRKDVPEDDKGTSRGTGGVQEFLEGMHKPFDKEKIEILNPKYRDELEDIALFDSIINNLDRHDGNWIFRESPDLARGERHIIALDHGSTFPTDRAVVGGARNMQRRYIYITYNEGPISTRNLEKLNMLVGRRSDVDRVLGLNLEPASITLMWDRIEEMRKTRKILRLPGK